ncbi:hypothetical protein JTE90_020483 [Oedothorax gibbosus]|uniref:Uncharacterized protein n=1 Tax=Oedothorax gibbosus TaxID=931172 RepID=A0AAV6URC5_9ARAC|nr:hypothetical protein JTE90_020483 [Oedothorax gibbosus]
MHKLKGLFRVCIKAFGGSVTGSSHPPYSKSTVPDPGGLSVGVGVRDLLGALHFGGSVRDGSEFAETVERD